MIQLIISPTNQDHQKTLEQIEVMTLAKKVVYQEVKEPVLIDNEVEYHGVGAIGKYLEEMEQVLAQWYECRCDKYEDL
ncbi:MAG: hypothetical protein AAFQ98_06030 [Bacteroidota bacterium]